ncbi:MAG: thiamine pyrophosphate-binding protein [Acidimicrobiales bacterium]
MPTPWRSSGREGCSCDDDGPDGGRGGQIADGYVICPWHAYEYDPATGRPPPGFSDGAVAYPVEERPDGLYVELPVAEERVSLMDQMVDVLCDWGLDTVFGMVGHSNLGLADALRKAEQDGRITYVGIRHEGAAAFAASAYAKVSGRPAACLTIAGSGATNLLTGLWDAKVDRAPILALTGQVAAAVPAASRPGQRDSVARQWRRWRAEKEARIVLADGRGRMHPALVFRPCPRWCPTTR